MARPDIAPDNLLPLKNEKTSLSFELHETSLVHKLKYMPVFA